MLLLFYLFTFMALEKIKLYYILIGKNYEPDIAGNLNLVEKINIMLSFDVNLPTGGTGSLFKILNLLEFQLSINFQK